MPGGHLQALPTRMSNPDLFSAPRPAPGADGAALVAAALVDGAARSAQRAGPARHRAGGDRGRRDARLLGLFRRSHAGGIALLPRRLRLGRADRLVPATGAASRGLCCGSWRCRWACGRSAAPSSSSSASITAAPTRRSRPAPRASPTRCPSDNALPGYFVDWFYLHGHSGHPLFPPDWLASDRPPLQVGYLLAQKPFERVDAEAQLPGRRAVVLQQLWIVGLWALLAGGPGRPDDAGAGDGHGPGQRPGPAQRLLRLAEAAAGGDAARRRGADDHPAVGGAAPQPLGGDADRRPARAGDDGPRLERLRGDPARPRSSPCAESCRAGAGSAWRPWSGSS